MRRVLGALIDVGTPLALGPTRSLGASHEQSRPDAPRLHPHPSEKNAEGQDDTFWLNIGAAFPHKDAKGYNLVLQAMPLDGKLVIREVSEPEPEPVKGKKG